MKEVILIILLANAIFISWTIARRIIRYFDSIDKKPNSLPKFEIYKIVGSIVVFAKDYGLNIRNMNDSHNIVHMIIEGKRNNAASVFVHKAGAISVHGYENRIPVGSCECTHYDVINELKGFLL